MTLPATGPISMSQIAGELGLSPNGLSLNHSAVRGLAGAPGGPVSFSQVRGGSAYTPMTVSAAGSSPTFSSNGFGGTASGTASCSVYGGSGGYSFSFNVISNPDNLTISSGGNPQVIQASFVYGKNTTFNRSATVSCTVTDNTGHSVTSNQVIIRLIVDPS